MLKLIKYCELSALPMLDYTETQEGIYYKIDLDGEKVEIRFCIHCYNNAKKRAEILTYKETILSFILNNKIYKTGNERMHWGDKDNDSDPDGVNLKDIITTGTYPKSPKDKLDLLFINLFKLQKHDGEVIETAALNFFNQRKALSLYFKNKAELKYYARSLGEQGYIDMTYNTDSDIIVRFRFTYKGLNSYVDLFEKGYNSKNCFIAMSFDKDDATTNIRNAIKAAITETGYVPILVDEKHFSDKTIPDEIIHLIRNCKFSIADFTGHKHGVYFEAGFAAGQGKPVIYTCQQDQFDKVHFDIKQFQHIIYQTTEELKQALINKIKAWIV